MKKKASEPLTKAQVDYIINEFLDRNDLRMAILCMLLFKCIRINDVLNTIRIRDIYNKKGKIKDILFFTESKTGKEREVSLKGAILQDCLKKHYDKVANVDDNQGLFFTQKSGQNLTADGVRFLLRKFIGKRGIRQCSCHSFRKAGSKYMYENNVRIEEISNVLNHHSTKTTEIYICLTKEKIREATLCLDI